MGSKQCEMQWSWVWPEHCYLMAMHLGKNKRPTTVAGTRSVPLRKKDITS